MRRMIQPPLHRNLEDAAFIQARLLDRFIAMAREAQDRETGFTRDSLNDLIETLREDRKNLGPATRPRLVAITGGK